MNERAQRRLWTAVVIVAMLASLVAAWMIQDAKRAQAPPTRMANAPRDAKPASPARANGGAAAPLARTDLPAPVPGTVSPATMARSRGAAPLMVCGLGPVAVPGDRAVDVTALVESTLERESPSPWRAMAASGDERIRAAGMALTRDLDSLVRLASTSGDAVVLATAQHACLREGAGDEAMAKAVGCDALDGQRRVALEPDNAVAWLMVAADAQRRQDAAAVEEALARASVSRRVEHHALALSTAFERHSSASGRAADAGATPWLDIALRRDRAVEPLSAAAQLCAIGDDSTSRRRESCTRLADLLHEQGSTTMDASHARRIATRWASAEPAELRRREALERAVAARARTVLPVMSEGEPGSAVDDPQRWACGTLGRLRQWVRSAGQQGAWPALRQLVVADAGGEGPLLLWFEQTAPTERLR
jgi:hypothetical protein